MNEDWDEEETRPELMVPMDRQREYDRERGDTRRMRRDTEPAPQS